MGFTCIMCTKHLYSWVLLGLKYTENLPIAKSFDCGQPAQSAQAEQVYTFRKSFKVQDRD